MTGHYTRPALIEDIPSVLRLWREMMDFHCEIDSRFSLSDDADLAFDNHIHDVLQRPDHGLFVALVDDEIVGYTLGAVVESVPVFKIRRYGFVADLTVAEKFRRRGIGKALWRALKGWFDAQELDAVQLNVSSQNPDADAFWRSCGFADFVNALWLDIKRH